MSSSSTTSSSNSNSGCPLVDELPSELHLSILTYLRAIDLSAIQRTCCTFNDRSLITKIIQHTATVVYPPSLTDGFDTPIIGGEAAVTTMKQKFLTYESLRNMEMLVVARVLSRPEPSLRRGECGFYISKSWCRTALRWLEVQQEERREREQQQLSQLSHHNHRHHSNSKKKKQKKLSKKQQRLRDRIKSDALPPWPNVNDDIICEHSELRHCSSKSARARRRIMDKQAWKILKRLYPDSIQLESRMGECLQCSLEAETVKRQMLDKKEKERAERKKPLSCPLVRAFYTRSRGVPIQSLVASSSNLDEDSKMPASSNNNSCPLVPGIYHALPRSWCHGWRKYLKTGEGDPTPPDASACLCDAHKLPLVPPHLDAFLRGKTNALLSSIGSCYVEEGGGYGTAADCPSPFPVASGGFAASAASPPPAAAVASVATPTKGGVVTPSLSSSSFSSPLAATAASSFRTPSSSRLSVSPMERFKPDHHHHDNDNEDDEHDKKTSKEEQEAMMDALRAAGLSEAEVQSQRLAMMNFEETNKKRQQHHHATSAASSTSLPMSPSFPTSQGTSSSPSVATTLSSPQSQQQQQQQSQTINESTNERLDKENRVVVEILTDEEFVALERWWPEIHSNYALRFAITTDDDGSGSSSRSDVAWSTMPCTNCDATGRIHSITVKKRAKRWDKKR